MKFIWVSIRLEIFSIICHHLTYVHVLAESHSFMRQWWFQGSPMGNHGGSDSFADQGDHQGLDVDYGGGLGGQSEGPRHHCFHLTARFSNRVAPDGVMKEVITLNDRFPGPTIRVRIGDKVTIRVTNLLEDSAGTRYPTSVHFHGIEQRGTPWWDGPELVTQCPIPFGGYMDYTFPLLQCGTYWYHSHTSWQYIEGFWGFFIVDGNATEVHSYDDEIIMSVMDWHHRSAADLTQIFHLPLTSTVPGAAITPLPSSALINGRGNANCRRARAQGFKCSKTRASEVTVFNVVPGLTYRIRVLNPSARAAFNISIDGHSLRVIELDGVDTLASDLVDSLTIWPAQRYSLLVTMNSTQSTDSFWIRADMHIVAPLTPEEIRQIRSIRPLAVIHYVADDRRGGGSHEFHSDFCHFVDNQAAQGMKYPRGSRGGGIQGRPSCKIVPWQDPLIIAAKQAFSSLYGSSYCDFFTPMGNIDKAQMTVHRNCFQKYQSERNPYPVFFNQMECPPFPITCPGDVAPEEFDTEVVFDAAMSNDTLGFVRWHFSNITYTTQGVYFPALLSVIEKEIVPIMFNPQYISFLRDIQVVVNNNNDGAHPFHLHGHTFWVIAIGEPGDGPYNPARDSWKLSTNNAIRRDTTHVHPQSWLVFRFNADNPGTWLFHCHIHWHLDRGLGAVFVEAERQLVCRYPIPEETRRVCEANRVLVMGSNSSHLQVSSPYSGQCTGGGGGEGRFPSHYNNYNNHYDDGGSESWKRSSQASSNRKVIFRSILKRRGKSRRRNYIS